jgi:hypothetical protein
VFGRGQPIYVFFETYDLAQPSGESSMYGIEAVLVPYKGKEDPVRAAEKAFSRSDRERGVSVSYTATARASVESQYLILDTTGVDAGTYLVGLRLTAESGRQLYSGRAILLES